MSQYFTAILDRLLPPVLGCWVGARPGTQALEIAHGLHLVLEKGLDSKSRAAIAQQDIQSFYDTMRLLRIVKWLEHHGVPAPDVECLWRHQLIPEVVLHIGSVQVAVGNRCMGGLTGSPVAGVLGRVPVESMIASRHQHQRSLYLSALMSTTFTAAAVPRLVP